MLIQLNKYRLAASAILIWLGMLNCPDSQAQSEAIQRDTLEFVESVPVETTLDLPEIRNTYDVWKELIGQARVSLEIETFYISTETGAALTEILDLIPKVARQGVRVRIISDLKFYKTYPEPLNSLGKSPNIEVRIIDFDKIAGGVMHAKYFIVDDRHVFLGSQNFDWRSLQHIHELGVYVRSQALAEVFKKLFEMDWQLAGPQTGEKITSHEPPLPIPINLRLTRHSIPLLPVFSPQKVLPFSNLWDEPQLVALIDQAQQYVNLHVLTYAPTNRDQSQYLILDSALRRAATRGVQVQVLCADWSKRPPAIHDLKSLAIVPQIQVKISTIPPHSSGFIPFARVEHCKYLLIDGKKFWIGSNNWSQDYFYNSRNVGLIPEDATSAQILKRYFENSWNSPYAYFVKPDQDYPPPRIRE